jgi:signal transduction histidine kinase
VTDTGHGIAPEDVNKLFNDFVRLKNEYTKGILGSGLGLSIVKKLALMYGGDVRVASEVGKGSTFTVELDRGDAT